MKMVNVGIGEYHVSQNGDDVIKTYGLGSCVAVLMYDRVQKAAGLLHVALPDSSVNTGKAEKLPGYFVDTGLPHFLTKMQFQPNLRMHFWIKLVGGANIMDTENRFDIGKRNVLAIKKMLWKSQLGIIAEDIGGSKSRTVSISVASGEVIISSGNGQFSL
jgi:chemotaxis protein CheD